MKHYFIVLLLPLIFYSFSSYASESYDYYVQCESCSYAQMEYQAKEAAKTIGRQDVIVFSTETTVIRAFNINVEIESEPGYQYVEKYSYDKSVSVETQNQIEKILSSIRLMRSSIKVNYTEDDCPTPECLTTTAGMGKVTTWLTANFLFPAVISEVQKHVLETLLKEKQNDFKITVCFDDGNCVEFKFDIVFSSLGWSTTGVTATASGEGSTSGGAEAGGAEPRGGYMVCDAWYTYTNVQGKADGTYCEGWRWVSIP